MSATSVKTWNSCLMMAEDQFMLHKLQDNYFNFSNEENQPRKRADALLSSLSQVCVGRASNRIPAASWDGIMHDLMKKYSATVDCSSEKGVNNYADGALALAGNHAADSSQWKSSLSEDELIKAVDYLMPHTLQEQAKLRANFKEALTILEMTASSSEGKKKNGSNQSVSSFGRVQDTPRDLKQAQVNPRRNDSNDISRDTYGKYPHAGKFEANWEPAFDRRGSSNQGGSLKEQLHSHLPSSCRTVPSRDEVMWPEDVNSGQGELISEPTAMRREPVSHSTGRRGVPNIWQNQPMKRKFNPSEGSYLAEVPFNKTDPDQGQRQEKTTESSAFGNFKTARQQLSINNQNNNSRGKAPSVSSYGTGRKVLGVSRKGRGLNSKFIPPVVNDEPEGQQRSFPTTSSSTSSSLFGKRNEPQPQSEEVDERLEGVDPKMVELIMKEIMDHGPPIHWEDIAGLEYAKKTIKEIVVWPMLRPDIFHGLRGPPKGLLLFGPPGTGKTLIGKCIASQSKSTFFSISASSLTSKWVGEGEKMVRALFTVARCYQPAVIFIDEIDSLLSQRSSDEHESSRRIKTEFLIQLDGATSCDEDRLLVVGATNRPQEIDEAARRRLVKRLYIPLPDASAREQIILNLLSKQGNYSLAQNEVSLVCQKTEGYSGADVANLCREAALGPIRSIHSSSIQHVSAEEVRDISYQDFLQAVENVRPSVSQKDLEIYLEWNKTYGSGKT
ncbi:fidgetin-like protein 1 isoform X1 [Apostichopus japonicus]|uniref:fidgetin-like protein 1 isoform X1 n=1 Tax=Stichopus japonicus TaxID=307972 RepID=UPI003AB23DC6